MSAKKLWWQHGIVYQIYPRSFMDTNGDGIGDLPGIIQRLDYLHELGVDAIWLSPINPSPDRDFGYDVADYYSIDPKYGNLADFDRLLEEAHARDIHIILDLVLNHTSDQNEWFKESLKSRDNPYHDWYLWRDPAEGGGVPNNWTAFFGGPGWEYNAELNQYYFHMFEATQPDLNWRNPQVREAMLGIFKYWLDKGVDGFRLDVFNAYFKDEEFRSNPRKPGVALRRFDAWQHLYDVSQPEMIPLLQEVRALLDQYPERYVVGETFLADSAQARSYIGADRLHAGFDYAYSRTNFSARAFRRSISDWDARHGEEAWPNYFFNNHDIARSSTRFCAGEEDARLKLLAAMHLTVRGTPYLYYGEEIGQRDISLKRSELLDPVGKRYWPFHKGRDGCRAPMQWAGSEGGGFSTGKPWLPLHADYRLRNVENQKTSPASLLNSYKALIRLRRAHEALYAGSMTMLPCEQSDLLVYERRTAKERVLVVLNFSRMIRSYKLDCADANPWSLLYGGNDALTSQMSADLLQLPAYGVAILGAKTG